MSTTIILENSFTEKICKGCGVVFFIPDRLEEKFKQEGGYWYCPNGHQYGYSEPDAVKYKRLYESEKVSRQREFQVGANAIESARKLREQLEKCQSKKKSKKKVQS